MNLRAEPGQLTYEDLCRLPEDQLRHEIIHGEHVVTPSPRFAHQVIVHRLCFELESWLREHPIGSVIPGPYDILLEGGHVLVPDLLFLSHEALARNTTLNLHGPPDLAVEVLSPATARRDRGVKREIYESSGTLEYWIVDPDRRAIAVYRARTGGRFTPPIGLELESDPAAGLESPLFPGFRLSLAPLFA